MSPHPASHLLSRLAGLLLIVGLLAGCTGAAPTPEPTPLPSPTVEPSATPAPPTDTPVPTPTIEPKPRLENLRFSTSAELIDAEGDGAVFEIGAPSVFAAVDYADLAEGTKLTWRLTGFDDVIETQTLTGTTGTVIRSLFSDPRLALPGDYRLVVRTDKQVVQAAFKVDAERAKPGTVILAEGFDDNVLGWELVSNPIGSAAIEDGKLTITVNWANQNISLPVRGKFQDFDLAVDITHKQAPPSSYATVIFATHLSIDLFPNGTVVLLDTGGSEAKPLLSITRSPAYKFGEANQLRLVVRGKRAAIYLNGTLIGSLDSVDEAHRLIALSVSTLDKGDATVTFDNFVIKVPPTEVAVMPTPTKGPTAAPKPAGTAAPAPTKAAATPPLADAIKRVRTAVEALGGALDRLYHGGGGEACGPLLANLAAIVDAPDYDVTSQPGNVQNAYGLYQAAIDLMADKMRPIAQVCLSGGGTVGKLDFDMARTAINQAGSLLTQALNALGE